MQCRNTYCLGSKERRAGTLRTFQKVRRCEGTRNLGAGAKEIDAEGEGREGNKPATLNHSAQSQHTPPGGNIHFRTFPMTY